MPLWPLAVAVALAYLLGSIPFGLLLTRLAGLGDIRRIGSGNIGATNVLRTGRKGLAAFTLLLDFGKGLAAVLIGAALGPEIAIAAAIGVVLGHMFPVWLRFKGGKGVATAGGVLMALSWQVGVAALVIWLVVAAIFRYSSLASLAACVLAPGFALLFTDSGRAAVIGLVAVLVIFRHRENVRRLLSGEESKIKLSGGAG